MIAIDPVGVQDAVVDQLRELARVGDGVDGDLAYFDGVGHGATLSQVVVGDRYDDGADVAPDGVGQVREVGDDGATAALLDEPAGRVDLGSHRAAREVPLGGVRAHLVDGHRPDVGGLGRAVAQHRVRYVGRDHEHVGVDGPR